MLADINELKHIELFKNLDNKILSQIATIATKKSYYKSSVLYFEDEELSSVVYLKFGLVKIYKIDRFDNEVFLYYIKSGRMVSLIDDLDDGMIRCYANTAFEQDSEIIIIDLKLFKNILLSNSELLYNFTKEIIKKSNELHCVLGNELTNDATSKVASFLYKELEIFNTIKRQEISNILHIQPETLSRILKKLHKNGIIDVISGDVIITDKEELCKYIG